DIYAFGILCHQIFAGRFPFSTQDPAILMKVQIYEAPLRLEGVNPALPESFSELLHQMVARDPGHRFPSARAVLQQFNRCLGETFSLKGREIPLRVLDSSDYSFHQEAFGQIRNYLQEEPARLVVLSGSEASGKSYLARQLKEALQLEGRHPWLFEDRKRLDSFL